MSWGLVFTILYVAYMCLNTFTFSVRSGVMDMIVAAVAL